VKIKREIQKERNVKGERVLFPVKNTTGTPSEEVKAYTVCNGDYKVSVPDVGEGLPKAPRPAAQRVEASRSEKRYLMGQVGKGRETILNKIRRVNKKKKE